jgi:hypothetical protein
MNQENGAAPAKVGTRAITAAITAEGTKAQTANGLTPRR